MCSLIKLRPQFYVHVLDRNTNVTSLLVGPQTYTCYEHQRVVLGPEPMVSLPPLHYAIIENPARRNNQCKVITDQYGQVQLRHREREYRLSTEYSEPFALYPGETFDGQIRPMTLVEVGEALRIRATVDFWWRPPRPLLPESQEEMEDESTPDAESENKLEKPEDERIFRRAGEMWLFEGPAIYQPNVCEEVVTSVKEHILQADQALKLVAIRDCVDRKYGKERSTGERWLMKEKGAYMPGPYEKVEKVQSAFVLSDCNAFVVKASQDHVDAFGQERKQGDQWLITKEMCDTYQLDVDQELVEERPLIVLTNRRYIVVENPKQEDGTFSLGERKIIRGPKKFFLQPPYEAQVGTMQEVVVLQAQQALALTAIESFRDDALNKNRRPGERWLHKGPGEYWPVLQATIYERKQALFQYEPMGWYIFEMKELVLPPLFFAVIVYLLSWLWSFIFTS